MIDGLEKILGQQQLPALVLADLASKGRHQGAHRAGAPPGRFSALGPPLGAGGDREELEKTP